MCCALRRLTTAATLADSVIILRTSEARFARIAQATLEIIYSRVLRTSLLSGVRACRAALVKVSERHRHSPLQDWARLQTDIPIYAAAVHARGAPYTTCWGFLDGTFRKCCRCKKISK
jgi:hypothetical protein